MSRYCQTRVIRGLIVFAALVLAACAPRFSADEGARLLAEDLSLSVRLDSAAAPLLFAHAQLCSGQSEDYGVIARSLAEYPKNLQTHAKFKWQLGTSKQVLAVRAGGPADTAGIQPGAAFDDVMAEINPRQICAMPVRLRYSEEINAYASGEDIHVTTELIRTAELPPLQLIIAHEMAHNLLRHRRDEHISKQERQADRLGLILLAVAGLDVAAAIGTDIAVMAHAENQLSADMDREIQLRRAHFDAVHREIKARQALGQDLLAEFDFAG